MLDSAMSSAANEPRRPMNTAIDLEIIRKLASDDLVSLIRKFQGNKVSKFVGIQSCYNVFGIKCEFCLLSGYGL